MVEADSRGNDSQGEENKGEIDQNADSLLHQNGANDESDGDGEVQASSFFSQVPFSSQQMLNGARVGPDAEGEPQLELFQMIALLHNEKAAPELLPFQFPLVESILRLISDRERMIDSKRQVDADDRFYVNIYKMELERVKFVIKSYLRCRLAKIERHLVYLIEKDKSELMS